MPVRHVLVVDDSKSARLMLRKMLQGFGLIVDTADSAEEALNYLRGQRPDAIFMDHTMPGLDGLAAVRQIKRDSVLAAIPVTMYTSKDEPAYQDEARAAGAIGVLVKPATPDALGAILDRMNALFDAAVASATNVPLSPPLVPAGETAIAEQFEKLALEKAELVVYDAIESQVLPLINDVIAKLRRDLGTGQEELCGRIAVQACEAQFARWQPPTPDPRDAHAAAEAAVQARLAPLLDERLQAFRREGRAEVEKRASEVANQICQSQLHELSERLVRQLSARFTEATHKAEEAAREAAIQAARDVALQVIAEAEAANAEEKSAAVAEEKSAAVVVEQTFHQLWMVAKRDLQHRIYRAAGWAAAVGVGAAVLVYLLR